MYESGGTINVKLLDNNFSTRPFRSLPHRYFEAIQGNLRLAKEKVESVENKNHHQDERAQTQTLTIQTGKEST